MRSALVSFAVVALSSAALAQDAGASAAALAQDAGVSPSQALEALDALYAKRDDAAALKELDTRLSAALRQSPNDFELLWRAARLHFWIADGATDERLKKQEGKQTWDYGEKAIKAKPNAVEGHYWAAVGIGSYSQAIGVLAALTQGLEGTFNNRLDRAIALNSSYDHGGPLLTKGRYHYELPWPKRDYDKAKALYGQVQARHPENLRKSLFLAELLLKDGAPKEALAEISKVANADVSYDPPEGRRIQSRARTVRALIEKELK